MRRLPALVLLLLVGAGSLALWALSAGTTSASNVRTAAAGVCRNQYSGPGCAGSTPSGTAQCQPEITQYSTFHPGPDPDLTVYGKCFGTDGTLSGAIGEDLRVSIFPATTTLAELKAAMASDTGISRWNACSTRDQPSDTVTCTVNKWSATQLTLNSFNGGYGSYSFVVDKGDKVAVQVWDASNQAGPAIAYLSAGAPSLVPANDELSSVGAALVTPATAFGSVRSDVVDGVIAVGLFQFIMWPANVFNSTFQENYADIVAWWEKWTAIILPIPVRRALRNGYQKVTGFLLARTGLAGRSKKKRLEREQVTFISVLLAGALLGALLDPWFGFNLRTAVLYLAILIALVTGVAVSAFMTLSYHRARKHGKISYKLEALPVGLAIAVFCVVISRATNFQPGYLYGVICGVAFGRKLAEHEEGHVVALSAWATVGVAVLAWLLWSTITGDADRTGSFLGSVFLDDFLASLFITGLVGTVISLFPLRFLPGHKLKSWHKGAWAATFLVALFVMVQVLLRPYSGPSGRSDAPLVTTIALFVLFAGGSLLFYEHFARKKSRLGETATSEGTIDIQDNEEPVEEEILNPGAAPSS